MGDLPRPSRYAQVAHTIAPGLCDYREWYFIASYREIKHRGNLRLPSRYSPDAHTIAHGKPRAAEWYIPASLPIRLARWQTLDLFICDVKHTLVISLNAITRRFYIADAASFKFAYNVAAEFVLNLFNIHLVNTERLPRQCGLNNTTSSRRSLLALRIPPDCQW